MVLAAIGQTRNVIDDPDRCYLAAASRDARFDGMFITAVHTTGIYCRPSCPAMTPKRENVTFFATAAAAQRHGFRACKRCRPDASPGSPEWNVRADSVARAVRLIADGTIDREGVGGLASRLGYSERQLNRLVTDELGVGPLALARSQRCQTARVLIETTAMPFTDIAFAAGFASIRQFNDTIREVFAMTPTEMRAKPGRRAQPNAGQVSLRLAYRQPLCAEGIFGFLARRAVPGVEAWDGVTYSRSLSLAHGAGVVALRALPGDNAVHCDLWLDDWRDLQSAVQRCRRLLDLDADPEAIEAVLGADEALAVLVRKRPGLRSPGHVDGNELAVRAVLGQQITVEAARTLAHRLTLELGQPLATPVGAITHCFPTASAIAAIDPDHLKMPNGRKQALIGMCQALADGAVSLDVGADRERIRSQLLALKGLGPWTVSYISARALGDPDVFLPTDVGVRHALIALGLDASPEAAERRAARWAPWRTYALHLLWDSLGG